MGDLLRLGDPVRAFWLTRSVARTGGTNLSEAMEAGILTPETYSTMVTRCRQCGQDHACEAWLAQGGDGAVAPGGCPNGAVFEKLARGRH